MSLFDRYREKGSRYSGASVGHRKLTRQGKVSYSGVVTTRLEYPTDYTGGTTFDDRQWMFDCTDSARVYNPVEHVKRHPFLVWPDELRNLPNIVPPAAWFGTVGVWKTYGYEASSISGATCCCFHDLFDKGLAQTFFNGHASIDWAQLVNQVGQQLDGRMVSSQNLIVSLSQMSQTIGMFKNTFGVRKLVKALKGQPLRKAYRLGPSAYLEYQFGWKNLYRDIDAIAKVWQEVRHHTDFIKKAVNKYISISERETIYTPLNQLGNHAVGPNLPQQSYLPYLCGKQTTGCFSLDLRVTEAMGAWSKWEQVLSRLGTRDLAEALWDLVPYSFVVDWFTHINRVIGRDSIAWSSYDLRRVGYSLKTVHFGKLNASFKEYSSYGGSPSTRTWSIGPQIIETRYERIKGFPPDTYSVGLFGNLTKTQIAEGLALIIQRI